MPKQCQRSKRLFVAVAAAEWHKILPFPVKIIMAQDNSPEQNKKAVDIGNASNAGADKNEFDRPAGDSQLLGAKAEKYMRQVTSPEEMPDAEESRELNEQDPKS